MIHQLQQSNKYVFPDDSPTSQHQLCSLKQGLSLFLESSVLSTVVKPDSLHFNVILAGQNFDPLWYHSNLVTFPFQKKL